MADRGEQSASVWVILWPDGVAHARHDHDGALVRAQVAIQIDGGVRARCTRCSEVHEITQTPPQPSGQRSAPEAAGTASEEPRPTAAPEGASG